MLKEEQRAALLKIAKRAVEAAAYGKSEGKPEPSDDPDLQRPCAAFVTLEGPEGLRGCIGTLQASSPLCSTVAEMGYAAACRDPRFLPITPEELPSLHMEISVLSPLQRIAADQVQPGVHGLVIRQGLRSGALLPQVAPKYGWGREEFLSQTCIKAGLAPEAWERGAEIHAFTAEVFGAPLHDI